MLNYPTHWEQLLATLRSALTNQYSDVAGHIILGHNFCHHIQYLLRLPGYSNYIERIEPDLALNTQDQYLDRPGVSQLTKTEIAIKGIFQYAQSPERRNRSILLWLGGPPYDVLGLNSFYSQGFYLLVSP